MVIAADGIHSALQRFVTAQATPVFSGQISYRGVLDTSRVPWWPPRIFQVWMGEGKHVIVFPVRAGRHAQLRLLRPGGPGDARVLVRARRPGRAPRRLRRASRPR